MSQLSTFRDAEQLMRVEIPDPETGLPLWEFAQYGGNFWRYIERKNHRRQTSSIDFFD